MTPAFAPYRPPHADLDELLDHTTDCPLDDPHRPDCVHDYYSELLRATFCSFVSSEFDFDRQMATLDLPSQLRSTSAHPFATLYPDLTVEQAGALFDALENYLSALVERDYEREWLTGYCLSSSLCPLHLIDYAICFDDDDPECAIIRTIHPSHDS